VIVIYDHFVAFLFPMQSVADTGQSLSDSETQIVLALIALIGTSIAALVYTIKNNSIGKSIAIDASEANRAVNNVGPGEHRLYDKVSTVITEMSAIKSHIHEHQEKWDEFNARWGNLPEALGNGANLVVTIHDIRNSVASVSEKVSTLDSKLDEYIKWSGDNYMVTEQVRADIKNDVVEILDHDAERDVRGLRYESG
jgi:hypothetical protein